MLAALLLILSLQFTPGLPLQRTLGLSFERIACARAEPVTVTDDTGWKVTLTQPATRIIALYGAFNELLLAMGLDKHIVARTKADAGITALRGLPEVGTHMRPNPELIVALAPHVVLQMAGRQEADAVSQGLRRLGVPVLIFKMGNFKEMFAVLHRLGVLTNEVERATLLEKQWKKRLGDVASALQEERRSRIFYEVRYPNLLAAGQDSIVNDIILHAGGRNVISTPGRVVRLNEEELIRHDPDVYIIQQGPMNPAPAPLEARKHYESLRALREGRTVLVEESAFARPGPRAVDSVESLAKWLHPKVNFSQ